MAYDAIEGLDVEDVEALFEGTVLEHELISAFYKCRYCHILCAHQSTHTAHAYDTRYNITADNCEYHFAMQCTNATHASWTACAPTSKSWTPDTMSMHGGHISRVYYHAGQYITCYGWCQR